MRKATGYLCAAVRGKDGDNVSQEKKWANIRVALQIGFEIRRKFPDLVLYIPHEHEELVELLLDEGVTTETLLRAMSRLAAKKDILFVYTGNGTGGGMRQEIDAVEEAGKEMVFFPELNEKKEEEMAKAIYAVLAREIE